MGEDLNLQIKEFLKTVETMDFGSPLCMEACSSDASIQLTTCAGAAGAAKTLAAHREYNDRPDVIAHYQEYRDGDGYAGHVVTDAIR